MKVYHRKYDSAGAQKTIDEFILNPIKGMDKVLYFLRDKSIDFQAIPKAKQTRELLMAYLDMPEITDVRVKWISKKLLDDELWRKLALKCRDYEDIPPQYTALKKQAIKLRAKRKREQKKVDELSEKENGWIIYSKGYDAETMKFFFCGRQTRHSEEQNLEFDSFDEFYKFMLNVIPERRRQSDFPRPLEWVDLSAYNFKNIDLSQYDLTGCLIQTKFLDNSNCFVNYLPKLLAANGTKTDIEEDTKTALISYEDRNIVRLGDTEAKNFRIKYYNYVSDIHLTHRILNQLGDRFTKEQAAYLIKDIAKNISATDITLVGGDTSESFEMNRLFYSLLEEKSCDTFEMNRLFYLLHEEKSCDIRIVILGNHELWDESLYRESPVDDVVDAYRQFFEGMNFHLLLQNDLYIENESFRYILSENEILEKDAEELIALCEEADTIILGGIGFTGYCKDKDPKTGRIYNAEFGLYNKALMTIDEDLHQTQRFEAVYDKVREVLSDRKVIVLTHMPKECWSKEPYVTNWVYVNGHTHRNTEIVNEEKTVFAGNQIGYHNKNVGLKRFCVMKNRDLFYEYLEDGIHEITVQQYREFNQSRSLYAHVNVDIGRILMLKKKKQYMFLVRKYVKSVSGEKLYILDGGIIHSAHFDEQYYYDNMDVYIKAVNSVFKKYWEAQRSIARTIKKIGGKGTVHGCIIDIDYYDHAYLNPFDGSLTFYYATSITDKYVYENLGELLEDRKNDASLEDNSHYTEMLDNYQKLVSKDGDGGLQIALSKPVFIGSTDMYKVSRIIKRFQYIADNNILRVWHDEVLAYYKANGKNQLMDFSAVFSLAEIDDKYEID